MGNWLWMSILVVPSLVFFVYLVVANVRLSSKRKALGLPPLGQTPRAFGGHRRKKVKYILTEKPRRRPHRFWAR